MDILVTIKEYENHMKAMRYADKTMELYRWGFKSFKAWLKTRDISDLREINHKTLLAYQKSLVASSLSIESRAIKIRAVKRLFEYMTESHKLLINPSEGIKATDRKHRKIGQVLTRSEIKNLMHQPDLSDLLQIRDRAIMEVFYGTGIRSNELVNLKVYDADLKDKVLFVRMGKGRRQRVVPLGKTAATYVKEYLTKIRSRYAKKNPKERTLFLSQTGKPMTWHQMRVRVNGYRLKAGLKKSIGLHTFRRTCATHMLQNGADIRYIQKLLGHKHLRTTQVYTKVRPVDLKKTHNKTHQNGKKGSDEN